MGRSSIIRSCDTTARSSGRRARPRVTFCRSRTVAPTTAARSVALTWISLFAPVRSRRCWRTLAPHSSANARHAPCLSGRRKRTGAKHAAELVAILDALGRPGLPPLKGARRSYANARRYSPARAIRILPCSASESWRSSTWVWRVAATRWISRRVNKGITAAEHDSRPVDEGETCRNAGVGHRGSWVSAEPSSRSKHAAETGRVVSAMDPRLSSPLLTLMPRPRQANCATSGSRCFRVAGAGGFAPRVTRGARNAHGLSRCIFRTNHASNYLPLAGTLSHDTAGLLAAIDEAQARGRSALRPEAWRAL